MPIEVIAAAVSGGSCRRTASATMCATAAALDNVSEDRQHRDNHTDAEAWHAGHKEPHSPASHQILHQWLVRKVDGE
eukprot:7027163-Heterocapsa_arctica.AAC.1